MDEKATRTVTGDLLGEKTGTAYHRHECLKRRGLTQRGQGIHSRPSFHTRGLVGVRASCLELRSDTEQRWISSHLGSTEDCCEEVTIRARPCGVAKVGKGTENGRNGNKRWCE
jgi:hypothetical protein